jgi:hypothetical protein
VTGPARGAGVFRPLIHMLPASALVITFRGVQVWFAPYGAAVVPFDTTIVGTHRTACPACPASHGWPDTPRE